MKLNNFYKKLLDDNKKRGYFLNSDTNFTKSLLKGLLTNDKRYGYQSCPCRLASGVKKEDLDIICPCDYRDSDLEEYGNCFCGLYVSKKILENKNNIISIPERRPNKKERLKMKNDKKINSKEKVQGLKYPIWRCSVCGYLCAREEPPGVCPICGADKERFERFI